jgi:hypothetical protein
LVFNLSEKGEFLKLIPANSIASELISIAKILAEDFFAPTLEKLNHFPFLLPECFWEKTANKEHQAKRHLSQLGKHFCFAE